MQLSDFIIWFVLLLLAIYFVLALIKLQTELRYRYKPFIAASELQWQAATLPTHSVLHTVFLVGDFGNIAPDGNDPVQCSLRDKLAAADHNSTLIFLGDNLYPVGMPPKEHRKRKMAEQKLNKQIELVKKFKGKVIYLSGNHDWNKGRKNGIEYLMRQQTYLEESLGAVFLPANGCPGPVEIPVNDQFCIIAINTQWWVQNGIKPLGEKYGCSCTVIQDFYKQLEDLLTKNRGKHILIAAHHPLYSNALHGGRHTIKHHLFPLTAVNKKLFLPLPLLGSLYPLYRKIIGASEDMSHPRYRKMRSKLLEIIKRHEGILYVAGHDHNLQHFRKGSNHFIVSGAASKTAYVRKGKKAAYTHEHLGYFTLTQYANNEVWLQAIEPKTSTDAILNPFYKSKL